MKINFKSQDVLSSQSIALGTHLRKTDIVWTHSFTDGVPKDPYGKHAGSGGLNVPLLCPYSIVHKSLLLLLSFFFRHDLLTNSVF